MRIVHASDWHGNFVKAPAADVYVFTGDMLPNFPSFRYMIGRRVEVYDPHRPFFGLPDQDPPPVDSESMGRVTDKTKEKVLQDHWLRKVGCLRQYLASPVAPVVVVRGNHDFTDIGPAFGAPFFEVDLLPSRAETFCGLKFGGTRGVPWISEDHSDSMHDVELNALVDMLPDDLDVFVTHAPPACVLDRFGSEHLGAGPFMRYVSGRIYRTEQDGKKPLRAHLFGHVHSRNGIETREGVVFSNAATTFHELDL